MERVPSGEAERREFLAGRGFRILERSGPWCECRIAGHGQWARGEGLDPSSAFDNALTELLGGPLGRALLDGAARSQRRAPPPAPLAENARPDPTPSEPTEPTPVDGGAAERPKPRPQVATAPRLSAEIEAELESLSERMDQARGELLTSSPRVLALSITSLAARARDLQARSGHPLVESAVTAWMGRLGELSRIAWPGHVPALQRDCTPAAAAQWLKGTGEVWSQVAELAESALEQLPGDGSGFEDEPNCQPAPTSPNWSLDFARRAISKRMGENAIPGLPATAEAVDRWRSHQHAEAALLRAAQELRWVRPVVPDPELWARLMGLLRWLCTHWDLKPSHPLVQALDPTTAPRPSWAHLLGRDDRSLERKRLARDLLRRRPSRATSDDALVKWFADAAPVFAADELAPLCAEFADRIQALDGTTLFTSGAVRDRLRKVQERLRTHKGEPQKAAPEASGDEDSEEAPLDREATLVDRAKERFQGSRALVVTNRADPHLEKRYRVDLGLEVDWCDASQGSRTVEAASARILSGSYGLVLCHTGFISHAMEAKVKDAAKAQGARYVPVYKGRVLFTARALLDLVPN